MKIHLSPKSNNPKTGPIPVTTSSRETCPPTCAFFKDDCYAEQFPLSLHWDKVTNGERGDEIPAIVSQIAGFPVNQIWRHNQAGDLPGKGNRINGRDLEKITKANTGKRGFTYTHKPPAIGNNARHIAKANAAGFTINLSGNDLAHADELKALDIGPVVAVIPSTEKRKVFMSPAGSRVVVCPATYRDTNCKECGLCQRADRDYMIAFPAHGNGKKRIDAKQAKKA